ncbi:uncharacterized protein LOC132703049 isoform X2 [Cylas formicarius]|uniref:uncharacterized protein LOC132703049 isoform X2 n=1 Tax=Cylas formicarius TaxID=197179 RepID=UPI002958A863|nr:uncharacterized protein LOC132703049 isoform X2 [Cylas formicarius]
MHEKQRAEVFVAAILTESITNQFKLDVSHLENTDSQISRICVISKKQSKYFQEQEWETIGDLSEEKVLNINSRVALFSTSNSSSSSELCDVSDGVETRINQENKVNPTILFKNTKVVFHPLVSVTSKAQANKLNLDSCRVSVGLLNSDSSLSAEFICRICHGGESMNELLTPCRCRGTVALVHLECLERWLKESNHSNCELCQHHYQIVREPKYSIPWSILVFLRHPGDHLRDIIVDSLSFIVYTPSAIASTYLLMMICEALVQSKLVAIGSISSHIIALSAVFGMAAIDFTYSSWLIVSLQKHIEAWRTWYKAHSQIKIILPTIKMRPIKRKGQ